MASHAPDFGRASALPLSAVLGSIPSYPRPVIERLVAHLIDRLDEQDGDPDREGDDCDCEDDTEDCCTAGDDGIFSGPGTGYAFTIDLRLIGSDDDAEPPSPIGGEWFS